MRITHNKVGQNLNIRDAGKPDDSKADKAGKAGKAGALGPAGADALADLGAKNNVEGSNDAAKVNLSQRAQDMKRAKELAMASPDVDEKRVAELQKLIDEGKYKVDAKALADKMVDEQFSWE